MRYPFTPKMKTILTILTSQLKMARTKQTARGIKPNQPTTTEPATTEPTTTEPTEHETSEPSSAKSYQNMTVPELKKVMGEKNISGRSTITKKEDLIAVLELYEQDPGNAIALKTLITQRASSSARASKNGDSGKSSESKVKKANSKQEPAPEETVPNSDGDKPASSSSEKEEDREAEDQSGTQDLDFKQIVRLTRAIGKRLKYIAREAKDDPNFIPYWVGELRKMKEDLSNTLVMEFGASVSD